MICNVPGEVAGWVRDANGGVQARDASGAALADAIRELLALAPEDRRALGRGGRGWVVREHDRGTLAARLDEALRAVVARTP